VEAIELFSSTMSDHSIVWVLGVGLLWGPVLVLLHELAHAVVALRLTTGKVKVSSSPGEDGMALVGDRLELELSPWILLGLGRCTIDADALKTPRAEAWVAAAGPAASLLGAIALAAVATSMGGAAAEGTIMGAAGSGVAFIMTAMPVAYGRGLGGVTDSDGRVVWRVLAGGPPGRDPVWGDSKRLAEPRHASPVALGALAVCAALALVVGFDLFLALLGLFGVALYLQTLEQP